MSMPSTRGVTRWRRSLFIAGPAALAVSAMTVAVLQGALAVNFAVTDKPLVVTSSKPVIANGGIAAIMSSVNNQAATNGRSVVEAGVHHAEMADICARVTQSVLGLPFTLVIKAGSGQPGSIQANKIVAAAEAITGNAQLSDPTPGDGVPAKTVVGLDAASLNSGSDLVSGKGGDFALRTDGQATVTGLRAEASAATVAGDVTMNNLDLSIKSGDLTGGQTCP